MIKVMQFLAEIFAKSCAAIAGFAWGMGYSSKMVIGLFTLTIAFTVIHIWLKRMIIRKGGCPL